MKHRFFLLPTAAFAMASLTTPLTSYAMMSSQENHQSQEENNYIAETLVEFEKNQRLLEKAFVHQQDESNSNIKKTPTEFLDAPGVENLAKEQFYNTFIKLYLFKIDTYIKNHIHKVLKMINSKDEKIDNEEKNGCLAKIEALIDERNKFCPQQDLKNSNDFLELKSFKNIKFQDKQVILKNLQKRKTAIKKAHHRLGETWEKEFLELSQKVFDLIKEKSFLDFRNTNIKQQLKEINFKILIQETKELMSSIEKINQELNGISEERLPQWLLGFNKKSHQHHTALEQKIQQNNPQTEDVPYSAEERLETKHIKQALQERTSLFLEEKTALLKKQKNSRKEDPRETEALHELCKKFGAQIFPTDTIKFSFEAEALQEIMRKVINVINEHENKIKKINTTEHPSLKTMTENALKIKILYENTKNNIKTHEALNAKAKQQSERIEKLLESSDAQILEHKEALKKKHADFTFAQKQSYKALEGCHLLEKETIQLDTWLLTHPDTLLEQYENAMSSLQHDLTEKTNELIKTRENGMLLFLGTAEELVDRQKKLIESLDADGSIKEKIEIFAKTQDLAQKEIKIMAKKSPQDETSSKKNARKKKTPQEKNHDEFEKIFKNEFKKSFQEIIKQGAQERQNMQQRPFSFFQPKHEEEEQKSKEGEAELLKRKQKQAKKHRENLQ